MIDIIIDTDLGYDCDDSGALVVANKLHAQKRMNLLAVTHCVNRNKGAFAIKKINEYYGNGDIPVGVSKGYAFEVERFYEEFFLKLKYRDDFAGFPEKPSFYKMLDGCFGDSFSPDEPFAFSHEVIVEQLEIADDQSVTLVCIGQLNTFATLVKNYHELLKKKVKKAVVMCGNFAQDGEYFDDGETLWHGEFNVIMDLESARTVIEKAEIPIDFIDFHQGVDVLTGEGLSGQTDNPAYKMYQIHKKGRECPSWDPIAVVYASGEYGDLFSATPFGKVALDKRGRTTFCVGDGRHRLVSISAENKKKLRTVINDYFRA